MIWAEDDRRPTPNLHEHLIEIPVFTVTKCVPEHDCINNKHIRDYHPVAIHVAISRTGALLQPMVDSLVNPAPSGGPLDVSRPQFIELRTASAQMDVKELSLTGSKWRIA
jgi:hypothetical protein